MTDPNRKPISKRLRYEILRRDNHTCRYCGGTAPGVTLTVDHIIPVSLGGSDEPENLVAACRDCNAGKTSSNPDAPIVDTVADDALRWAAAMEQASAELSAQEEGRPDVHAAVDAEWHRGNRPANWTDSIDGFLAAGLPAEVIVKMARVAQDKTGDMGYRWSYFCGCCWRRVREMQDRAAQIVAQPEASPELEPAPATTVSDLFACLRASEAPSGGATTESWPKLEAIAACPLCDSEGYKGMVVCDHIDRSGRLAAAQHRVQREASQAIDRGK